MPGNPADVGAQPFSISPTILEMLRNQISPKAAGMNAFSEPFFGGLNKGIDQMPAMAQNQRMKALMTALQQQRQQGAPQAQAPQMPQMPQGPQGPQAPNPFLNALTQRTGLNRGPLSMGGGMGMPKPNDPLGLLG